ncbi:hypothetical protein [Paraburkholderia sediminicola]|uniref:hypothetical protein n=1 Tax=Paraburkholderia sediminicola TaxID=458836 RepID=UPI0038B7123C
MTIQAISLDGKMVGGDQRALQLVSAYGSRWGVALGQVRTANKSNRITAMPELFDSPMGFLSARRKQHALGTRHDLWRKPVLRENREYGAGLRNPVPYRLGFAQVRCKHKRRNENTPAQGPRQRSMSHHSLIKV